MRAFADRRPAAVTYFIDYDLVIALLSGKRPALSGGTRPAPEDQKPEQVEIITRQLARGPLRRRWLIDYAPVNQFFFLSRVLLAGKRPALV